MSALGHAAHQEACKHQTNGNPLLRQQGVAIPEHGEEDVEELAGGAYQGVGERSKGADGEEDEELADCAAEAEEQHVRRCPRVLRVRIRIKFLAFQALSSSTSSYTQLLHILLGCPINTSGRKHPRSVSLLLAEKQVHIPHSCVNDWVTFVH